MSEKIVVNLSDAGFKEALVDALNNDPDLISPAIDYTQFNRLSMDDRATVDRIEITEICLAENNRIEVYFELEWSAFYGCDTMDVTSETEEGSIVGTYKDGHLIFDKPPIKEIRSTHDEL